MTDKNIEKVDIVDKLLQDNEANANVYMAKVSLICSVVSIIWFVIDRLVYQNDSFPLPALAVAVLFAVVVSMLCIKDDGKKGVYRYLVILSQVVFGGLIAYFGIRNYWFLIMMPLVCSIIYCDEQFTVYLGIIIDIIILLSLWLSRSPAIVVLVYFLSGTALTIVCRYIASRGKKQLYDMAKIMEDRDDAKQAAHDMKTNIMISQIQPHFLYNTLMAITGIEGNPPETMEAIADFGQYLRENLNILQTNGCIPFTNEIGHVELYVSLEKLRFEDRLNVTMDLQETEFMIPPLTLQMIVENAIKHGISKKAEGGTVSICSYSEGDNIIITVDDDGVGFDTKAISRWKMGHIGLRSVSERLKEMVGGTMDITSIIDKGTSVVLTIPKENARIDAKKLEGDRNNRIRMQ